MSPLIFKGNYTQQISVFIERMSGWYLYRYGHFFYAAFLNLWEDFNTEIYVKKSSTQWMGVFCFIKICDIIKI